MGDNTKLSASQAAKEYGKSVPTITRAIKAGRLSAKNKPEGGYIIDRSELIRVFGFPPAPASDETPDTLQSNTTHDTSVLEVKLEAAEQRIKDLQDSLSDTRTRLDSEGEERRRLTAQLVNIREQERKTPPEPQSDRLTWRERFLGKKGA